jgi:hypothetical protein
MDLTNINRMLRYIAGNNDQAASGYMVKRNLQQFISSTSKNIIDWLDRDIELKERTEYKSISYRQTEFNLNAYPVSSISSVFVDCTGLHNGENDSELDEDSYTVNEFGDKLVTDQVVYWTHKRGLKVTYTGGISSTCARSTYSITGITGLSSISAGLYCFGDDSGAVSTVYTSNANSMTIDVLYGTYADNETVTMYTDEPKTIPAGVSATLSTCTIKSLAEECPEIVAACENEVYYRWKNKGQFENSSTQKDGNSTRGDRSPKLRPETIMMIHKFKRYGV